MKAGILMALAVAMSTIASNTKGGNDGSFGHGIPDNPRRIIPKGCQVFMIKGFEVIALTRERAYIKLKKKRPDLFF